MVGWGSANAWPAAPLAALATPNPALSVTALAVTGRAGGSLAAASAAPGAGFASRGIVKRPTPLVLRRTGLESMKPLCLTLAFALCLCTFPTAVPGQILSGFPLHAIQLGAGECDITDPCAFGISTTVLPGFLTVIYIWTRNTGPIAGIQTAFDWDPGTWTLAYSEWDCQQGQLTTHVPSGPGPVDGTISTVFDCATYGASSWIIGKLYMIPSSGCLRQVQSALAFGTCVCLS